MKMEFLFEDIGAQVEPTDEELRAYLEKHSGEYRTEPRIGFRQVFINADRRGAKAETDAREILARLSAGAAPETVGDVTMLEPAVRLSPLWDVRQQYGETFSNRLLELKPGRWEGPLSSGFGLHLVRIEQREEGSLPELSTIREEVKLGWLIARQQELKDAAYARLKERYRVVVEKPAETSVAAAAGKSGAVN
jgi:parvulin-like peptidyl-prolyl isomerase